VGDGVRVLRRDDVRAALGMAGCIDVVEAAFVAASEGRTELPGVIHLDVPDGGGEVHVKAGYVHGSAAYAVKVASGFTGADAGGPGAGRTSAIDGLVLVFDASDGSLRALLLDGGELTDLRTGAAGGVAARWLAPSAVRRVAVIGTGIQARRQVEALRVVHPEVREVRVWGRDPARTAAAAADVGGEVAHTVEQAAAAADVVITCTASREPLVFLDMLAPGAHVTAVGSDGAGKQELDPAIVRAADVVVVDSLDQCRRLGELQHAPGEAARAVELGDVIAGRAPGRTDDAQQTVCDLTGVGVQDVAAATAVLAGAGPSAGEVLDP